MTDSHLSVEELENLCGVDHERVIGVFQGGEGPAGSICRLRHDERDDLKDPERDVASRLEEMKSRESIPIIT